jgi:putative ABC transport system permease protein
VTKLIAIAIRNLARYTRRTLLTAALIAVGVVGVTVFSATADSFKRMMIGQMTDSMLGHLQIHRAGYVASIDNLPLTLNMSADQLERVEALLRSRPAVASWSPRLKFGALVSNYAETTSIRLNAVYPDREFATVPLLPSRIAKGSKTIVPGEILIPDLLASGLGLGLGDPLVIIATNRDGSVNAAQLRVGGVIEGISGPGGRDGYLHVDDAAALLRLEALEISEVAVRLHDFDALEGVARDLRGALVAGTKSGGGKSGGGTGRGWEVHTWDALSPFASIAAMIDVLTIAVRLALVAVVLISVMNVMLMSVYERVREIGTMAAMGTPPGRITTLFLIEGLAMGVLGASIGGGVSVAAIAALRAARLTFDFGRQSGLVLTPSIGLPDLLLVSALVALVAVAGSLQPAFKASRMEPVQALRHA